MSKKKKTTRKQRQKPKQAVPANEQTEDKNDSGQMEATITWFIMDVLRPRAGTIVISLVAIIAVISGGFYWQKHQKAVKAEALAEVNEADKISELKRLAEEYRNSKAGEKATYKLAVQQFHNNKFRKAAQSFQNFIEQYPESTLINKAKLGKAYATEADGRYRQAMEAFEQLVKVKSLPQTVKTEAYVGAGRTAKALEETDTAIKFYEKAIATEASGYYNKQAETALQQLKTHKLDGKQESKEQS